MPSADFERTIPANQAVADIRHSGHENRDRLVSILCALIGRRSIHVATRRKAWLCDRLLVGIAGSNPAGGMDMSLVSAGCCEVEVSATGGSLAQGRPTEWGVSDSHLETSTMRTPRNTRAVES